MYLPNQYNDNRTTWSSDRSDGNKRFRKHGAAKKNKSASASRAKTKNTAPFDDDDDGAFRGVEINPIEYDNVSAVTEGVMTTAHYMNSTGANHYPVDEDMEQSRIHNYSHHTTGYEESRMPRYQNDYDDRTRQTDPDIDPYDDFCKKVFNTPTVAGGDEWEDAKRKDQRAFRKKLCFGLLGIIVITFAVFGVLFGIGILDVSDFGFGSSSSSENSSNSLQTGNTQSPTRAPAFPTTTELLPESSDNDDNTSESTPKPTSAPTPGPTASPTSEPTTRSPTLPDTTPFPTAAPVTPQPTQPPTTTAPVSDPPTPGPTEEPTPLPTTAPETDAPTLPPTTSPPTVAPTDSNNDGVTTVPPDSARTAIRGIRIRMEEEAYADYTTAPPGGISKRISLSLTTVNGNVYRTYYCFNANLCGPSYVTINLYEWLSFPDPTEWFLDDGDGFRPLFDDDLADGGLESGPLELRIHVEDDEDYLWTLESAAWFRTQTGLETSNRQDVNGRGPWMRWQFDTYRSDDL